MLKMKKFFSVLNKLISTNCISKAYPDNEITSSLASRLIMNETIEVVYYELFKVLYERVYLISKIACHGEEYSTKNKSFLI